MTDKITLIKGAGKADEMAEGVRAVKANMKYIMEMAEAVAEIRRKSYEAHIRAGFNPNEALDLCKKITL